MNPLHAFVARHRFLLGFVLLTSTAGISVGLAKVTTSLYALSLGASATSFGLIAGAQSIGILFMSLAVGVMVDQYGPGRLFRIGCVLVGLVYLAVPFFASVPWLLTCTALVSFVMPLRFVSLNTVFMQQLERVGETKAGWFRGSHMLGMFLLGPVLAAGIVDWIGFAASYWLIGTTFVAAVLLAPLVFGPARYRAEAPRSLNWRELRSQMALLADDVSLRDVSVIEFVGGAAHMYYSFFIVAVAVHGFGLGASHAAGLISLQGAAYIAALFLLGAGLPRLGEARFYLGGFTLASAGLLLIGLARAPVLLWLGAPLLGLGLGIQQIANLARFARIGARLGRGKVAGLMALVGPAGGLFGSVAGGVLGELFGLQPLFLCFVPCFLWFAWRVFARRDAVLVQGV
ncbi:MFS transporter [Jeongeupia naejangsanensis]|uniref:MFS transporter n=1 Tax=Jeongeupia naejangsanensis TaxID=613195 RepID=UPI0027E3FB3B|nr:MFS transporter [Jeongeupia naejangsanensis]